MGFLGSSVRNLRRAPFIYDMAFAAALVPVCAVVAYKSHSSAPDVRDWQFGRLAKSEACETAQEKTELETSPTEYKGQVAQLRRLVADLTRAKDANNGKELTEEIGRILGKLNAIHCGLVHSSKGIKQRSLNVA